MAEIAHKKISWSFVAGIILIISGFLGAALNAYFIMIGFAFFLAGAVLVLISRKTHMVKALTIIIPPVLYFIFFFIMYSKSKMEPAVYLIPANYRGEVNVIFDEPCGAETNYRNGRRLYVIPPSGILFTKFKQESGSWDNEYIFTDSLGNETPAKVRGIDDFLPGINGEKRTPMPRADELFVIEIGMQNYSENNEKQIKFEEFEVCTFNELKTAFSDKYRLAFNAVRWELVKKCREQNK